jgi:hypothetical protein
VLLAEDISEGVVYDKGGVKVTAFVMWLYSSGHTETRTSYNV